MNKQEIKTIKISELHLWTENPRDPIKTDIGDLEIIKRAIKNEGDKWNLPKLIQKMGGYYHFNKLPLVVEENGKFIVFDGNCRIAILKYLQNPHWSAEIEGSLFPKNEPKDLKNLSEIPCAVCDRQTALDIIYQDNTSNNTWSPLTQSYFEHYLLQKEKSLFLEFEETTGLISKHEKLNQRFVKDEVITEKNLESIGFSLKNSKLLSSSNEKNSEEILKLLISLIEDGTIKTRNDKEKGTIRVSPSGDLGNVLKKFALDKSIVFEKFDSSKKHEITKDVLERDLPEQVEIKRTPVRVEKDIIFGRKLELKSGEVNKLYSGIYEFYELFKKDSKKLNLVLPIVGMSLRLILDIAGREIVGVDDDNAYKTFLKKAKTEMNITKQSKTFLSLTNSWLDDKMNIDGILGKYAHGNITIDKGNVINLSKIAGDILEFYFKKPQR